jgi:hypothetical protein
MVYRFKIWFEENDEVSRVIDLRPTQTFFDFHNIVLDSIGFRKDEMSSFFLSDYNWRRGLEITLEEMGETEEPKLLMKDTTLKDFINDPHQRIVYVTDFLEMWTLKIELQSIQEGINGVNYPLVSKSIGKAPKQNEGSGRFKIVDENEFDEIAGKMANKQPASISDENGDFDEDLDDLLGGDDEDLLGENPEEGH